MKFSIKHLLSVVVGIIIEEIIRFTINTIYNNLTTKITMDATFLITVPICLIILLGYWGYLYLNDMYKVQQNTLDKKFKEQNDLIKILSDKIDIHSKENKEFFYDYSVRIQLLTDFINWNRLKFPISQKSGLTKEDYKYLGIDIESMKKLNQENLEIHQINSTVKRP